MVRHQLAQAYRSDLPHLLLSLASVQGLTYASQMLVARVVSPEQFGAIRTIEVVAATVVVVASLGMPTLSARFAVEMDDAPRRGSFLCRAVGITQIAAFLAASIVALLARRMFPEPTASALVWLIAVIAITATGRVLQGYSLGVGTIRTTAAATAMVSLLSLPILLALTSRSGLSGWLVGRYLTEGMLVIGLFVALRPTFARGTRSYEGPTAPHLIGLGAPIAISLLLRTGQDAVGLLSLNLLKAPEGIIGQLGLATLVVAALSVVPGAIANLALPRMTQRRASPAASRQLLLRSILAGLALTLPLSVLIVAFAPVALATWLPAYSNAARIVQVMALIAPCRAVVAMAGSCLLAHLEVRFGLWVNGAALLGSLGGSILVGAEYGGLGVALVVLAFELALATVYALAALRLTRTRLPAPTL